MSSSAVGSMTSTFLRKRSVLPSTRRRHGIVGSESGESVFPALNWQFSPSSTVCSSSIFQTCPENGQIGSKIQVGFPYVTRQEWQLRDLTQLPNNAFKPTPFRCAKHMAGAACHVLDSTTRCG